MASLALTSNACYSSTVCLSSFILGMQGLCKELFHPAMFCLHCSYAYEAKAAFLLENGKHESGAWVALQPVSFSQLELVRRGLRFQILISVLSW